jgi:hypothetical protein
LLFAGRIHFPLKFVVNVQLGYGQSDLFIGRDSRIVFLIPKFADRTSAHLPAA